MSNRTPTGRMAGRVTAVAGAALLGLGLSSVPAAADTVSIDDGTLNWGVKESFRDYVTGPIGGGQITVSDGAVENDDGTFGFVDGSGDFDDADNDLSADFEGTVVFQAHGSGDDWELDLTVSNLSIDTDNASGVGELVADVASKDADSGEIVEYPGVSLVDLDVSDAEYDSGGGEVTGTGITSALTEDGAEAFAGFYDPGEEFDPVEFTVVTGGDSTEPVDSDVHDGNLDWGVKESFRDYIVGPIADGGVELSDGAEETSDGYRFPGGSGDFDADTTDLDVEFAGEVRFYGHDQGDGDYELDLTVSQLSVQVADGEGTLYVEDTALVDIDLGSDGVVVEDDVASVVSAPTALTDEGAEYFNGFYEPGTEMDPVTFHLALSDDAQLPGGGAPGDGDPAGGGATLAMTGASMTIPVAVATALLLAGAIGFWLTRRRDEAPVAE